MHTALGYEHAGLGIRQIFKMSRSIAFHAQKFGELQPKITFQMYLDFSTEES